MNMQILHQVGKKFMKKMPVIKPGCTVKVHQKIKEGNKERIQLFEGLVIAVNSGTGPDKTFTVRRIVGGIGVEKIFPVYSKNISKVDVTKSSKIRRSKLYYMRKRSGKSARLREKHLTEKDVLMEDFEEEVAAAPAAPENAENTQPEEAKAPEGEAAADPVVNEKAEDTKPEEQEAQPEKTEEAPAKEASDESKKDEEEKPATE